MRCQSCEGAQDIERSDFFRAACREKTFLEGQGNVITLRARSTPEGQDHSADEPRIIYLMLTCLYITDPESEHDLTNVSEEDLIILLPVSAELFLAADKYGISGAKNLAYSVFDECMRRTGLRLTDRGSTAVNVPTGPWTELLEIVFVFTPQHLHELRDVVFNFLACPFNPLLDLETVRRTIGSMESLSQDLALHTRATAREAGPHTAAFALSECVIGSR